MTGPGANSYCFNAGNLGLFGSSVAPAQIFSDDAPGDVTIASNASSVVYPNAQIRMGFASSSTAFSISRSSITLNPPAVGNLGTVTVTGTSSVSLALRSFLLGFVNTAATFLSDSAVSDVVLRNGVSNGSLRIGFGTGSASSVVMNVTRSTFNTPITVNQSTNQIPRSMQHLLAQEL
jgi:hypothetical protein